VLLLEPGFAAHAAELGLRDARLRYDSEPPTRAELESRLARDLERGSTGIGPHLDDVGIVAGGRDVRTFGSQGEQRVTVLALLLAEADLLRERRSTPPLLLLDDVLSELDPGRRETLAASIREAGQAIVTTTTRDALPSEPDDLLAVTLGDGGASVVTRT
jgi:DNA replication and repair protein RecF